MRRLRNCYVFDSYMRLIHLCPGPIRFKYSRPAP